MSDEELWGRVAAAMPPFGEMMGLRIVSATRDRVEAELDVRPAFGNRNGVMHGGAIMALADLLGGTATIINLPDGHATTTIESKTNFFAPIPMGDALRAVCTPLHRGRTTMVWQTEVLRGDGRRAALVTQTQIVLPKR